MDRPPIPEEIKREVRQKCGFGCIFCGLFIYEYAHIDAYEVVKSHDPKNICLLCPNHHTRFDQKKLISKSEVKRAHKNPIALKTGYANEPQFSLLKRPATIVLGRVVFLNPGTMIQHENDVILGLNDQDGFVSFNARFTDATGALILEIINNEWRAFTTNWDVQQTGNRLRLRNIAGRISLSAAIFQSSLVVFDDIQMNYKNYRLETTLDGCLTLLHPGGGGLDNVRRLTTSGPISFTDGGMQFNNVCIE
jgi:hypothetical protein